MRTREYEEGRKKEREKKRRKTFPASANTDSIHFYAEDER